jgi:glycerol kinase
VGGGATENNFLMQFQTDILNCSVKRPQMLETTALGAAYLAGLAVGFWKNIDKLKALGIEDKIFEPEMDIKEVDSNLHFWQKAIKRSKNWVVNLN